jgi:hypothetical protein
MVGYWLIGKDLEGSRRSIIEVLSGNWFGETEEIKGNPVRTAGVTTEI